MSKEVLACRVCLSTEAKLYNMHQYQLDIPYEIVTGCKVSNGDGLPNHTCSYCGILLLKYATFQKQCLSAQKLLHEAVMQNSLITTKHINSIDRETYKLTLPYSVKINVPVEVKSDSLSDKYNIKLESNDEKLPVTNVNKKPRKRHKGRKSSKQNHLDNVNVKIEIDDDFGVPREDLDEDFVDDASEEIFFKQDVIIEEDLEIISSIKDESIDDANVNTNKNVKFEDSDEETPLSEFSKKPDIKAAGDEADVVNHEVYIDDDVEVITLSKQEQIDEILARKESPNYINSFYKCDVCYKGFISEVTFKNHMERHDPRSGDYVCEVCGSRWANARTLRAHAHSSHLRRYRCKRCEHVAKSSFKAREHSKWHEGVQYVCSACGAAFAKPTSRLTHMRLRHGAAACRLCGARLLGEAGLRAHMRRAHRFQEKQLTLHCMTCQTTFKTAEALTNHNSGGESRSCAENKWCSHCGSGFESFEMLKEHAVQHREEFACALSKATLVYHLRTHTGEKPYQCSECPKRFSVLQRLQIHIRTHTGESPFKCDLCPKAFKHKAALNRHHRVHTGVKPYQCVHCGKAFSQSNSMKGHVRTVHLKMPPPYRNRKRIE